MTYKVLDIYDHAQYVVMRGSVDPLRRDLVAEILQEKYDLSLGKAYGLVDKAIELLLASRPKPSFWRRLFGGR